MARQRSSGEQVDKFPEAQQSEEEDVGMNEYERERAARIASLNAYLQPALDAANDLREKEKDRGEPYSRRSRAETAK
ncbi:hypothetical protein M758_UG271300 [Ceratodon purpureus]|nr:hypothetical protein M758_UG271300 [Ceratodon purpureus]